MRCDVRETLTLLGLGRIHGQKSPEYSAVGQITGLCPCKLQAPSATRLAGQPVVQSVTPIFIVGPSVHALF
jgi:hypothetical protein